MGCWWFGATAGGSRFDGDTWQTFTAADGLVDNNVGAIVEGSAGALWFGTTGGVSRFDGFTWQTFTALDGLVDSNVGAIVESSGGVLWFGTTASVSRFEFVESPTSIEKTSLLVLSDLSVLLGETSALSAAAAWAVGDMPGRLRVQQLSRVISTIRYSGRAWFGNGERWVFVALVLPRWRYLLLTNWRTVGQSVAART